MKDVMLIDSLNSLFQLRHTKEKDVLWKFISDLRDLMEQTHSHKTVLCCDTGSSAYRLAKYPAYKSDRKLRRENATPQEKAEMSVFFDTVSEFQKLAPMFGIEVSAIPKVEADDILAFFTREIDIATHRMSILSSDTDLFQLLRPGVRQRSYGPKMKLNKVDIPPEVWVTYDRFCEVFEMSPFQYMQAKSIAGDPGDSIYSPEGIGKETGFKLIRKYGSIEEVEKHLDELDIPRFSEAAKDNLRNEFWMVDRNVELVSLLHTPEKYEEIFGEGLALLEDIKDRLADPPKLDEESIKEWLFSTGRVNVYNDYDNWIRPFRGR